MRTLRLDLDSDALVENWRVLDRMSGSASTGAAVKAEGYGLGGRAVTEKLREAGCSDFFVAHWTEARDILRATSEAGISVLHGVGSNDLDLASQMPAKPVINSLAQAKVWIEAGGGLCDLMIDTGMFRLGLAPEEVSDPLIGKLKIDICMSHLASADEDCAKNAAQQSAFSALKDQVRAKRYSLANSAGIALGSDYHFDLTRPGIAIYGGVVRPELCDNIRQVVYPKAAILQTRDAPKGSTLGYNGIYTAPHDMRLATISLGYADGYLRGFSNKGHVHLGGQDLPVVGRVSMDLTIIDITEATDVGEGDWVDVDYSLPEAAAASGLSQYELLTVLGSRFQRRWS
ncbi:alanine racemase [Alterisphingorhabdus coralli]|uniref:alanine racemase n=1 Tax=Alterisphingorhabdus coralli TaxID=3071408 RepID=A0AA97I0B6_9SPHN|nr:alanine racemase [Parasphingorhabdus sp. SCSIO 66989]WOE74010.1 alanine racemase [Parasphingorhabdus sp. SCSIO 66989]